MLNGGVESNKGDRKIKILVAILPRKNYKIQDMKEENDKLAGIMSAC